MVVLPAMRAFSRPLRTWARMILAGTPVRASASGTPSSGRFSMGTQGVFFESVMTEAMRRGRREDASGRLPWTGPDWGGDEAVPT